MLYLLTLDPWIWKANSTAGFNCYFDLKTYYKLSKDVLSKAAF